MLFFQPLFYGCFLNYYCLNVIYSFSSKCAKVFEKFWNLSSFLISKSNNVPVFHFTIIFVYDENMFNLKEILDLTYGNKSEEKKKQLSIYIINNSKLLHKRFNNKKF